MSAVASCSRAGRIVLQFADLWIWTDQNRTGYGYWYPCCQVRHQRPTTARNVMRLIDNGVRVEDYDLFPA